MTGDAGREPGIRKRGSRMNIWQKTGTAVSWHRYPLILCVLTLCMAAIMELRFPYFFLQDDNRVQHLPLYVHNLRALLNGEFPFYNFHQYLGTPVGIQYAALYPINYIGLALSKLLLGHYLGAMEFIAVIHLIIAGLGFFYLMHSFDLEEPSCLFGAVAYTFCGCLITFGNSWIQTLDCAAYLPWLLLFSLKLAGSGGYAIFLALVLLRVLALLVGYPQLYVYIITFEFLTVAAFLLVGCLPVKGETVAASGRFKLYLLSHVAAPGIVMPLLLSAYYQASVSLTRKTVLDWKQYIASSYDLKLWFTGLVAPFSEAGGATWNELHFLSHVGYLTLLCAVAALLTIRTSLYRRQLLVFSGCALFALMWSGDTIITRLIYHLPLFGKFKHPFKLAVFASFYLVVIASFGFDLICRRAALLKHRGQLVVALLLILHVINFAGLYSLSSRQYSFAHLLDKVPFDEPLKATLSQGRIVSVWQNEINDNQPGKAEGFTAPLLGYDYATLWGLYHLGGHDSLVSEENFKAAFGLGYEATIKVPVGLAMDLTNIPLEYFRNWGVRWYLVDKAVTVSKFGSLQLFYEDAIRKIYFDPAGKPFAFWGDSKDALGIQHEFRTNSIILHTQRSTGGSLLVNVFRNPFFTAEVDGRKIAIAETNTKQVLLEVPAGSHVVVVGYADPYFMAGMFISLLSFVLILGYGWFWRRKELQRDVAVPRQLAGGS